MKSYRVNDPGLLSNLIILAAEYLRRNMQSPTVKDLEAIAPWASGKLLSHDVFSDAKRMLGSVDCNYSSVLAGSKSKDIVSAADAIFWAACPRWLMSWRWITNITNSRSLICSALPFSAVGNSAPVVLCNHKADLKLALLSQWSSLVCDYVVRNKIGGTNFSYSYFSQIPSLPPSKFTGLALEFLVPRALSLVYTSHSMLPMYEEIVSISPKYDRRTGTERAKPFPFDPEARRSTVAEINAFIGHLWGLSREELVFILDPRKAMGENYPSETFRGLRDAELKEFGEYRTQRLVLEAWDRIVEPLRRGQA